MTIDDLRRFIYNATGNGLLADDVVRIASAIAAIEELRGEDPKGELARAIGILANVINMQVEIGNLDNISREEAAEILANIMDLVREVRTMLIDAIDARSAIAIWTALDEVKGRLARGLVDMMYLLDVRQGDREAVSAVGAQNTSP